ncbi:MAG: CBS domain-containing protein [Armatimonadetes bacterium]|nr:CBS domain-containing protein [Armatimonadota bacterium]
MEYSVIHELVHRLKVSHAMSTDYVTVPPNVAMRVAQQRMREARAGGMPVTRGDEMVGIVTTEDVILWLDGGGRDDLVEQWMTRDVVTVDRRWPLTEAMGLFGKTGFGRLPVLDEGGQLCGVITPESILKSLLDEVSAMLTAKDEAESGRATMDGSVLRIEFDVPARDYERAGMASVRVKRELAARGFKPQLQRRVAIATHECETNLIIHTTEGGRIVALVDDGSVKLTVSDKGPGIEDIERAMVPGFSTASDFVRDLGFGAGMGLPNIRKCADRFEIRSKRGSGTWLHLEFDVTPGDRAPADPPSTDGGGEEVRIR